MTLSCSAPLCNATSHQKRGGSKYSRDTTAILQPFKSLRGLLRYGSHQMLRKESQSVFIGWNSTQNFTICVNTSFSDVASASKLPSFNRLLATSYQIISPHLTEQEMAPSLCDAVAILTSSHLSRMDFFRCFCYYFCCCCCCCYVVLISSTFSPL